ncbi:biotin--[acetyl-CoA-carboxylase] ligase [Amylibacter marinus]|uniref:biotin--[biotin carboxyl-carrier protein] ligase n=1 Tax=Amylibacter marinus TaxID=1475483 RepID=A0ABQ5VTV7_9RHOB|nr:biotin--[acetyl-CoA-carboxylase] ligase [Amylibacter marinus]GLQ34764.1 biotin--[acetyl-CoA-carboxylase] ligase [Amylibacter marinus]
MSQWPQGFDRVVLDEIDSTNAEAKRRADQCGAPLWIMAWAQSAGVGRRGRVWNSARGNFSATLLKPINGTLTQVALHSFVTALALYDALVEVTGTPDRFTLKWPNDVLCDGRKLAGILLETCGNGPSHLCIGVGVNLAHSPDISALEAGSATPIDLGAVVGPEDFLEVLAAKFAQREANFATHGFGPTRTAWLAHAARIGQVITARMPRREITGIFHTIDDEGAVVIEANGTRHAITAADIFFES